MICGIQVQIEMSKNGIKAISIKQSAQKGIVCNSDEPSILSWIQEYREGRQPKTKISFLLNHLPPYTQLVLREVQKIPFGETISYKELANRTGNPKAYRAAANACGRNPFPLFIPCHRIVAHDGTIGGYSFGIEIKKFFLKYEEEKTLA